MEGRLIVDLPTSVAAQILVDWLHVPDRVRLDSAFCQASVREEFLQVLGCPECSFRDWLFDTMHDDVIVELYESIIKWANKREVLVEKVAIERNNTTETYEVYWKKFGKYVRVVQVRYTLLSSLLGGMDLCSNLLILDCCGGVTSSVLREVFMFCRSLRQFRCDFKPFFKTVCDQNDLQSSDLDGLVCPALEYVDIKNCCELEFVQMILHLAVNVSAAQISPGSGDVRISKMFDKISSSLTALALGDYYDGDKGVLWDAVSRFSNLVCLGLRNWAVTVEIVVVIGTLEHLKSLDLSGTSVAEPEEVLGALVDTCGDKLTELSLSQSYSLPIESVQVVLPRFTQLTSFGMHYDEKECDRWDLSLLGRFTSLRLVYDGDDGAGFANELSQYCKNTLQELYLTMFDNFCWAEDMHGLVSTCNQLRRFHMTGEYPFLTVDDAVQWRALRPNLVVGRDCNEELDVFRELDRPLEQYI